VASKHFIPRASTPAGIQMYAPALKHAPTGFVFEACEEPERPSQQGRLVQEFELVCNQQGSR